MNDEREPLTPDEVLSAVKACKPATINDAREKHPDWVPKLPWPRDFDLRRQNLSHMDLRGVDFSGIDLSWSNLQHSKLDGANFSHARLTGANLQDTTLFEANFFYTSGLYGHNRALCSSYQNSIGAGSEHARFRKPGDHVPWSILRSITTFRVFGASYITIVVLVAYAGWVEWVNNTALRWASMLPADGTVTQHFRQMLLSRVPLIEVAPHFGIQLVMVLCLAVGATLYQVFCPDFVKENTESRWTRELNQSLIEYRSADASFPLARTVALFFYGIGGLYTLAYVLVKIIQATLYFLGGAVEPFTAV
jgi:hypothetical protein